MANDSTLVTTGRPRTSGGIWLAPKTATLPTDATTALGSEYVCLGHISEDGVTNGNEVTTEEIKAWGKYIVASGISEFKDTFQFALLETKNPEVKKFVYGEDNVTVDDSGAVTVHVKSNEAVEHVIVFELALRGGKLGRLVIPLGAITERGDIVYKDDEAVMYEITVTCYPDGNGDTHIEYYE